MMEDTPEENYETGDAAQAFEDLRAEVSVMRQALAVLPRTWAENQPPDYSLDLARIVKGLNEIAARLDGINKHPALTMRPEQYRQAITQAGEGLVCEAIGKFGQAAKGAESERQQLADLIKTTQAKEDQQIQQLADLIGTARAQKEQRGLLWWKGGIAAVVALAIGLIASPYLVGRFFRESWQTDVAAIVMSTDRWDAGIALMQAGNPEEWSYVANASNLVSANQKAIAACKEEAAKTKMSQKCNITVQ